LAAVAASASQVRTLKPSRPLSRPPRVGSTWSLTGPGPGQEALGPRPGTRREPILFVSHEKKNSRTFFIFGGGVCYPPSENEKSPFFMSRKQKKGWAAGQGLPASPWPGPGGPSPAPGGPSPAQNVGSGPNHQKWPESASESMVRPENRSRSMPGLLRSVSDQSRGQKKVKKSGRAALGLARPSMTHRPRSASWSEIDATSA